MKVKLFRVRISTKKNSTFVAIDFCWHLSFMSLMAVFSSAFGIIVSRNLMSSPFGTFVSRNLVSSKTSVDSFGTLKFFTLLLKSLVSSTSTYDSII